MVNAHWRFNAAIAMALMTVLAAPFCAAAGYTPWAEENLPMHLLWGDTHLHSSYSVDANTMGNTALSPADAYRFARGEAVRANNGMLARLDIPLDFLVVSDHAELMGIMLKLREGDPRLLENPAAKRIHEVMANANPYQFGMIGSTDSHTSLATAAEDNFWGKASMVEPGTDRTSGDPSGPFGSSHPDTELTKGWTFGASGYAAVWARGNTREAIFEAMRRREVYATTGSRISLRFFAGWDFEAEDAAKPHAVRIGYRKGVPMGSELGAATTRAPGFMLIAMKDPQGANLDRVQVVKGWRDASGALHEKVYNVAVSENREIAADGHVDPLKATVDLDGATYLNTIGEAQFSVYWQDPQFDPAEAAFYYARVIEIPTPRWTVYDAVRLGKTLNAADPKIVQDRAYSSPIWYNPE
ncbi:MAG: DUF3604 domain-containing protein [Halioglobus sp.]